METDAILSTGTPLKTKVLSSPIGPITIIGKDNVITGILLGKRIDTNGDVPPILEKAEELISHYLDGERVDFRGINILVPEHLKSFFMSVMEIPYGETVSYKEIAKRNGIHPRTAGLYLSKNPVPVIVPCHRVIKKDGTIGGFSAGIEWKKFLLRIEGITNIG